MPVIESAKKRARQNVKRRDVNNARKSAVKTAIKKLEDALESGQPIETAKQLLRDAEAKIARSCGKGGLHANTAARRISKLAKHVAIAERKAK